MANNLPTRIVYYRDCKASELDSIPIVPGTLIYCHDIGEAFYDALDGSARTTVSKYVHIFGTEIERQRYLQYDTEVLYIVLETSSAYIYSDGWVNLSASTDTFTFTLDNLEIPTNGYTAHDGRIREGCSAVFTPIPSLVDLYKGCEIITHNGSADILLNVGTMYPIIGKVEFIVEV